MTRYTQPPSLGVLILERLPAVIARCGISRSEIFRRVAAGKFPAPIKLGARGNAWDAAEIDQWVNARRRTPARRRAPIHSSPVAISSNNMHAIDMSWRIEFYNAKVATAVEGWPAGIRANFLRIAELMADFGPELGMPHTRAMRGGLFEIRAKGREGIGRAFFCTMHEGRVLILHAFVKKAERTPQRELAIARARLREVHHAEG